MENDISRQPQDKEPNEGDADLPRPEPEIGRETDHFRRGAGLIWAPPKAGAQNTAETSAGLRPNAAQNGDAFGARDLSNAGVAIKARKRRIAPDLMRPGVTPFGAEALSLLMPMHILLSPAGRIIGAGPLIGRVFPQMRIIGRSLFSLFTLRGPSRVSTMADLTAVVGQKLQITPRRGGLRLRGLAVPLGPSGDPSLGNAVALGQAAVEHGTLPTNGGALGENGKFGMLLNLSFGIDIVRAVDGFDLTDADFAATDMTMELLYLAEANALVMDEMRALSRRLDGARRQAEAEAMTDPLTGLRNRRACDSFLARLCREGNRFSLMQLDLDHFKEVNDSFGHAAGDQILQTVATILTCQTRAKDCIARIGGDEFILVLPGLMSETRLQCLAQHVVAEISKPVPYNGALCRVSASIGTMTVDEGLCPEPAAVLAQADRALYAAKDRGRGCVVRVSDLGR